VSRSYETIHVRTENDVAIVSVLPPPLNQVSEKLIEDLWNTFEELHKYDWVKGVILTGTGDHFIGGWDIVQFQNITDKTQCLPRMMRAHRLLNAIENGPKPVIAAINGHCSRGGMEVAMACHYRLASNKVRIGLLDVRFGLIPGLGGTQRLPRLVGIETALEMMTAGRDVTAAMAEELGLIEEAVAPETLLSEAIKTADAYSTGLMSIQASMTSRRTENLVNPETKKQLIDRFRKRLQKRDRGYLAPFKVVEALELGLSPHFESDIQKEISLFCECASSDICRNLISLFLATRSAGNVERFTQAEPARLKRIGILGGGSTGAAIAASLITEGFEIWMWDDDPKKVQQGLYLVRKILKSDIRQGKLTRNEFDALISQMLRLTSALADFAGVDLIFDTLKGEKEEREEFYRTLQGICRKDTFIAIAHAARTAGPLSDILESPQRLLGIRFVNPIKRMQLMEISINTKSADRTVATAIHLARRIGKIPVVVKDVPGFFINRVLFSMISEFCFMVGEGVNPYHIDKQITDFGLPVGPAQMCDFNGMDTITDSIAYLRETLGERWEVPPLCYYLNDSDGNGQSMRAGWYVYQGEIPAPNLKFLDALKRYLAKNNQAHKRLSGEDILTRIIARAINEAVFAFQDAVSDAIAELDLAVVYGVGFPPYRGGIFRYADAWGIPQVVNRLLTLAEKDSRFSPAPLLAEMAASGKTFYSM